jgi:hypothetical protein
MAAARHGASLGFTLRALDRDGSWLAHDSGMNRITQGCALVGALAIGFVLSGCGSSATATPSTPTQRGCREGVSGDVAQGARKAGQGVEQGAEVGVAGVKQAAAAAGGFLADGGDGAEQRWNERKAETDREVAEGNQERKAENLPPCP